jgi:hypothetical protein
MIPQFNDFGYLPPGIHAATLDEIDARFGEISEIRRVQMQSIRWMIDTAIRAGVRRFVLNGSFVTDIMEPNDVDCVLLIASGYPIDQMAGAELEIGFPFLDISLVGQDDFRWIVNRLFGQDRAGVAKGMIEVVI